MGFRIDNAQFVSRSKIKKTRKHENDHDNSVFIDVGGYRSGSKSGSFEVDVPQSRGLGRIHISGRNDTWFPGMSPVQQMTPNESKSVGLGQGQQGSTQTLNSLVGTLVTVQRMPLCQPGTYSVVLSYAGKQAKVVSTKPSKIAPVSQALMDSLTPQARAMIDDGRNAAGVLVQFDDGTKLDTCVPILPSKFSDYFELASGQTLQPVAQDPITPTHPAPQPEVLSNDEVNLAMSGNGRSHWVFIEDEGFMAAQGNQGEPRSPQLLA
jgi:hypothetical protein